MIRVAVVTIVGRDGRGLCVSNAELKINGRYALASIQQGYSVPRGIWCVPIILCVGATNMSIPSVNDLPLSRTYPNLSANGVAGSDARQRTMPAMWTSSGRQEPVPGTLGAHEDCVLAAKTVRHFIDGCEK